MSYPPSLSVSDSSLQFDEKELELLISGTPDIDVDDWRSATEYHGYSPSDAVIVWWWRALKSFSRADRAKVLSFATGTAKVPLGGFAELPVRFIPDDSFNSLTIFVGSRWCSKILNT